MFPDPQDFVFDERRYLKKYPNVISLVKFRQVKNGREHFFKFGANEGLQPFWTERWHNTIKTKQEFIQKSITFVIPCYNNLQYTKQTVNSIIKNTYQPNFIFVDNGSETETSNYLQSLSNSQIISNPQNFFVTKAWNQGLTLAQKAKSDYICLCNNDIIAGKNWTEPILNLFQNRENEFYYPTNNHEPYSTYDNIKEFQEYGEIIQKQPIRLHFPKEYFIGFCIFFRKEYLDLFLPIPEELKIHHGDDYVVTKLRKNGIYPAKVNKCFAYHFLQTTQKIVPLIEQFRTQDGLIWKENYDKWIGC